MSNHVVIGAGPVGTGTALVLAEAGHRVTVATRTGNGPDHPNIQRRKLDASNAKDLHDLAASVDAMTIINCANPPYTSWEKDWPPVAAALLQAAKTSGAALVTMSNLYGYGPKHQLMRADTPLDAIGPKGRTRADMWRYALAAHQAGDVKVAEVRASDFYGPGVVDANMGERVVPRILAGKGVQLLGSADVPHSFSYMPDVAKVVSAVALDPSSWGRPWLVPSLEATQRALVDGFAREAGMPSPKVSTLPAGILKLAGLFIPMMKALQEINYQFAAPFVVDATDTTDKFSIAATPMADAARETIAWWKSRS